MKNLFVSYEIALKLKEKGFDELCISQWYNPTKLLIEVFEFRNSTISEIGVITESTITAPMYQQVIDWLMEEHLFFVNVDCTEWMHTFVGNVQTGNGSVSIAPCHDYYEALNGAIELALNSI